MGLLLDVETPDHASIWRFGQTIDKLGLSVGLLAGGQPAARRARFIIKRGTLVDATIIAGAVDARTRAAASVPSDPEARFTLQARQDLFRLQGASGGGRGEGRVRQSEMTRPTSTTAVWAKR